VRGFTGNWVILRPGNVYGPGDEVISTLLQMIRTLPIIPMVELGDQQFQPIWYDDLGLAIAKAVEKNELSHATLELAGNEITSMNDVLDRLGTITGNDPTRIPVPAAIAAFGAQIAESFGVDIPIDGNRLTMLLEENVIGESVSNALIGTFEIQPTSLDDGLRALVDLLPEQMPGEGYGEIERKRFWADITGSQLSATELLEQFRTHVTEIMPIDFAAEPGVPHVIEQGGTMTGEIPLRGVFQMRAEEVTPERITLVTVQGHPLAGVVRFSTAERTDGIVRFQIILYAQPATIADWVGMKTVGSAAQDRTWTTVVENMVERSGGKAPKGVESEERAMDEDEAAEIEEWIREVVIGRKREENRM
jgi:NADH dehydrogenase